MSKHSKNLTEKDIQERLSKAPRGEISNPYPPGLYAEELQRAAVLIPLLHKKNAWHILFIHRTANQHDPHSGQVAFPGGASESSDLTPEATALRETQEEIGLNPKDVQILGQLNDHLTITSYQVTPIVARIPWPYPLNPARDEVSRIFTIPLDWLADPDNHEVKKRKLPHPYPSIPVIYFKPYDKEVLWGASARFTIGLLALLFGENSTSKS